MFPEFLYEVPEHVCDGEKVKKGMAGKRFGGRRKMWGGIGKGVASGRDLEIEHECTQRRDHQGCQLWLSLRNIASRAVVAQAFNPSTWGAEAGRSL